MNFEIPKIVKTLALKEYAPEFGDAVMHVWVNPPRKILMETKNKGADAVIALMSDLWSQGPDGTHVSTDEVVELVENTIETDPGLFLWMRDRTFEMIGAHRSTAKKA